MAPDEKTEVVRVRCTEKTKTRWHHVVAEFGLNQSEDALVALLDLWDKNKLVKGGVY